MTCFKARIDKIPETVPIVSYKKLNGFLSCRITIIHLKNKHLIPTKKAYKPNFQKNCYLIENNLFFTKYVR